MQVKGETVIKLSSLFIGASVALLVAAVLMVILGINFHAPVKGEGAALYSPAKEVQVEGVVANTEDFVCPVSGSEIGSHLQMETADGRVQVHLAPARILRSRQIGYRIGDRIVVIGSRVRLMGNEDVIAREITRETETIMLRDPTGELLLTQY